MRYFIQPFKNHYKVKEYSFTEPNSNAKSSSMFSFKTCASCIRYKKTRPNESGV